MGIRFSKSIKLGNYLRLNLSGSGVSATVGKTGASVTIGKKGTFLNLSPAAAGIRGTGLSYRQKISGNTIGTLFGGEKKQDAKAAPTSAAPEALPSSSPNVPASLADKIKRPNLTGSLQVPAVSNAAAVLGEYEKNREARVHIHRYAEPVLSREAFDERIENSASETGRELYAL
ncbi:MAG: DUF4236 domain-containing protein, partial [Lachnospiraceae bacterium]|nr:DUF4236 domain-containing protein [Lachnospiraceae bacterium]